MTNFRSIPFGRPWITDEDRRAVMEVLEGPILAHGPQGKGFEADFAAFASDDAHCVAVSSCMAALHLACLHFGIGLGDEVIVPAQTHVATVHAIEWTGARPVFADCDPATGNLTAETISALITPRTKAVSVVHFVGIPCNMPEIVNLAENHGLKVIEDCALALGSRHEGRHAGLFGDAGCFSFYPVKHITTGEGGMFITRHEAVAQSIAKLRAFGVDRSYSERAIPGIYDVTSLGLNYRMSEIQAALGRTQLSRANYLLEKRGSNFSALKQKISKIEGIRILDAQSPASQSSYYCMSVVFEKGLKEHRDAIVNRLKAEGIGTSVYYPHPVPRLKYYSNKYGYDSTRFPNAVHISDHSLALPTGLHLSSEDIDYIAEKLVETVKEIS